MGDRNIYDEVEIEDMTWDAEKKLYHYPCPCGDRFEISLETLRNVEDRAIALCPSCSLKISVIFDIYDLPDDDDEPVSNLPASTAVAVAA